VMKSPRSCLRKSNAGLRNIELNRLVAKNFSVNHLYIVQFSLGETLLHTYTRTDRQTDRQREREHYSPNGGLTATPYFFLFILAVTL